MIFSDTRGAAVEVDRLPWDEWAEIEAVALQDARLGPRRFMILYLRLDRGWTLQRIAQAVDLSRGQVSRIIKKSRLVLTEKFPDGKKCCAME